MNIRGRGIVGGSACAKPKSEANLEHSFTRIQAELTKLPPGSMLRQAKAHDMEQDIATLIVKVAVLLRPITPRMSESCQNVKMEVGRIIRNPISPMVA